MGGVPGPYDGPPLFLLPGSHEVALPPTRLASAELDGRSLEGNVVLKLHRARSLANAAVGTTHSSRCHR